MALDASMERAIWTRFLHAAQVREDLALLTISRIMLRLLTAFEQANLPVVKDCIQELRVNMPLFKTRTSKLPDEEQAEVFAELDQLGVMLALALKWITADEEEV